MSLLLATACGKGSTLTPAAPASPPETNRSLTEMLSKMEQDWAEANLNGDLVFQDKIMADDYIAIMEDGTTNTKTQWIDFLRSGQFKAESLTVDGIKVRVFGDTAIVTYHQSEKSLFQGKDYSGQTLWTDVFLKRNGQWQIAAEHGSRINEPKQ